MYPAKNEIIINVLHNNKKGMKKTLVLGAAVCVALAFTSCKSQESAYKKAYEKAKAQEEQNQAQSEPVQESAPVVTPLVEKPATQTTVTNVNNATGVRDVTW
jgi:outer membrane lipoprotein SlyB